MTSNQVWAPARTNQISGIGASAIQNNQNQGTFHACRESTKSKSEITKPSVGVSTAF